MCNIDYLWHSASLKKSLNGVKKNKYYRGGRGYGRLNPVVDLLVVVDHAVFRKEVSERGGDEYQAFADIRRYYTLLVSMVT